MTTQYEPPVQPTSWPQITPTITDLPHVPLYSEAFAANPHRVYDEMRHRFGALAPVELWPGIPATLVIGYWTAVRISHDPDHFSADPRRWQKDVPADCPVLPMLEYRPNALRSSGRDHERYRKANLESIDKIDLYRLQNDIEGIAIPLINSFCEVGRADLLSQYAFPLTFSVLNAMIGCPPEIGERIAAGMAVMFEGAGAAEGSKMCLAALADLIHLKRFEPGADLATRMVNHESRLTDEELGQQLFTIYGAGIEPLTNLMTNTLLLMLAGGRVTGAASVTTSALNELLFKDPPLANFGVVYPKQPILVENVWLPADQPVVISMAACNNDPAIAGEFAHNHSHLAWGTGPHVCPAKSVAYIVAQNAIDQLLDALPEVQLAVPAEQLVWRPGPFHRSLASLPVVFPESPPLNIL